MLPRMSAAFIFLTALGIQCSRGFELHKVDEVAFEVRTEEERADFQHKIDTQNAEWHRKLASLATRVAELTTILYRFGGLPDHLKGSHLGGNDSIGKHDARRLDADNSSASSTNGLDLCASTCVCENGTSVPAPPPTSNPTKLPTSPTTQPSSSPMPTASKRPTPSPEEAAECEPVCLGMTCDWWADWTTFTCAFLEDTFSCDCSGCWSCENAPEKETDVPTLSPVPTVAPVPTTSCEYEVSTLRSSPMWPRARCKRMVGNG